MRVGASIVGVSRVRFQLLLRILIAASIGSLFLLNILVLSSYESHFYKSRQLKEIPRAADPKLVWLMSFPNSGTSFTSRLVRDASLTVAASNYADETPSGMNGLVEPVYKDQPNGPFWIKPEADAAFTEPGDFILTKTHCGMRCTLCPPEKYVESISSFRRRCLTSKWMEDYNGTMQRTFSEYSPDRVTKAVHLIRNPLDNIVSRFHLEQQIVGRTAKDFEKSRRGFRAYCASIASAHAASEKRVSFLENDVLKLMRQVPCHEDFVRYIEWHNLAFVTTADLELDTYVLHFDWFATRYKETVTELLDFLSLKQQMEPPYFEPHSPHNYFTSKEVSALKEAFKIMASPQTWSHVAQYLEVVSDSNSYPSGVQ